MHADGSIVHDGIWENDEPVEDMNELNNTAEQLADGNLAPQEELQKDLQTKVKQFTDKRDNLMSKVKDMEKGSTSTTQGKGTYTDTFGREYAYKGKLKDGKPNGRGKGAFSDGTVYDGLWMDGKMWPWNVNLFQRQSVRRGMGGENAGVF